MQLAEAEPELIRVLDNATDSDLRNVALYAISQCGSKASLKVLATAAERVNYAPEKSGATEAYIALVKRVLAQGDVKDAEKAANDMMKVAEKNGQTFIKGAAQGILIAAKPSDVLKLTEKALKDKSREYRYAALNSAAAYADQAFYNGLLKIYAKATPEIKTDISNWLCQQADDISKQAEIKALDNKFFIGDLYSEDIELKTSVANLLARMGGKEAVLALAGLLNNVDAATVSLGGEKLLNTVEGNISEPLEFYLSAPATPDAGKTACLRLMANRKYTANAQAVISQVNTGSPEVRNAAYAALKDVVSSQDLPVLYTLLENAGAEAVPFVQQAVITALEGTDKNTQLTMVSGQIDKAQAGKQYLYYPVLASTGQPKALEMISALFAQQTGAAKDAAFQALLDWKGREVAGQLLDICKDPSATIYFDRALNRYIQLASDAGLTGENRRLFLTNALEIAKTDAQKNNILKLLGQTNSYLGMLLAGEYLDNKAVQESAAQAVMNIALNNKSFTGKNVKDLLNKVIEVLNNPDAGYQKEAIRKHLAEMPDEEGFISIFNGKDLTGWKGLVENPIARGGKMKPAELAKKQQAADKVAGEHWSAQDGILFFDGIGGENLCTDKQYGDFEMYVDWNLDPAGPRSRCRYLSAWHTAGTDMGYSPCKGRSTGRIRRIIQQ